MEDIVTDKITQAAKIHSDKQVKMSAKPFNIKKGWNFFIFNKYDIEDGYYENNPVVLLGRSDFYCEQFIGELQPKDCQVSVSLNLFSKISALIIRRYKTTDEAPINIGVLIKMVERYDRITDARMKSQGKKSQRGRIRYFVGIIDDSYHNKIKNHIKFNKEIYKLEEYLEE